MNIVLLSGGSGKRLWPLSNDIRSKQFIKIFKENGSYRSMVQRVYSQIKEVSENTSVLITTSKKQVSVIKNQLGNNVDICVEPCRRDTFPAIVLACAYLKYIKNLPEETAIAVSPVDPYVEKDYFNSIECLVEIAEKGAAKLALMGIEPTYPSEKYGYIIPKTAEQVSQVSMFKEKPTSVVAAEYISAGALWNSGVFAFKIGYVLKIARKYLSFNSYDELYSKYEDLPKVSFDYEVVEKEKQISVMRFNGMWSDLGTWNTLTEAMEDNVIGDGILNENCENVHIVNETKLPILAMGLKNVVISASPEGILVSDKQQSSYIKPFVDSIDRQVMFAEKSWGSFRVLEQEDKSLTILVTLNKGNKMNYHSHQLRDEVWTVISGHGTVVMDGKEFGVTEGDVVKIPANTKHTVKALSLLKMLEVQLGEEISVNDKIKFSL